MSSVNNFDDYSKISSNILYLGINTTLKINVRLDRTDKDKKRVGFYNEYRYRTDKFIDKSHLNSISIITDSYLSIEQKSKDYNAYVMIRDYNMTYINQKLDEACGWFYQNVFAINKEKRLTIINGSYDIITIPLSEGKYIRLEPIIMTSEDQLQMQGIRLYISSDMYYVDININKFMGFVYNMKNIYIYGEGMKLLNLFGRPPLGTNMHNFSSSPDISDKIDDFGEIEAKIGTTRKKKVHKDMFDMLSDTDE